MCTERYGLVDRCSMAHRALARLTIRKVANRAGANACCPGVALGLGPRENLDVLPRRGMAFSTPQKFINSRCEARLSPSLGARPTGTRRRHASDASDAHLTSHHSCYRADSDLTARWSDPPIVDP